jgi:hypothetical protein
MMRALPGRLPHHVGLLGIHAGRPIFDGHVEDVYRCPVLATDLARIRFSIMVANQQLSSMELKLQMTLHIPKAEAKLICTPSLRSAIGGTHQVHQLRQPPIYLLTWEPL